MTHKHKIVPLTKRNIETCNALLGVDLGPLAKAGGSFSKITWVTYLLIESTTHSGCHDLHAVLMASDYSNPLIASALDRHPDKSFRVITSYEGSLSEAYDFIPEVGE